MDPLRPDAPTLPEGSESRPQDSDPLADPLFSSDEAAQFHAAAEDAKLRSTTLDAEPLGRRVASALDEPTPRRPPAPLEQLVTRRYPGDPAPVATVYRSRRPAIAVLLIVSALVFGLIFLRILAVSFFGPHFSPPGVIASCLALISLPLLVVGGYGLVTGAAHGAEQYGFRLWARPPLAYLLIGLVLATAAALAAR